MYPTFTLPLPYYHCDVVGQFWIDCVTNSQRITSNYERALRGFRKIKFGLGCRKKTTEGVRRIKDNSTEFNNLKIN